MKKYFGIAFIIVLSIFVFVGCEKVSEGNYKEGTYVGSVVDDYGGAKNTVVAVVYVDSKGLIKSVYLDTTYTKDGVTTTKKSLGNDYGMKARSEAGKEWYEQVNLIESKVIENQDISFIKLDDNGKTDTIAGVTMKIDALYNALDIALKDAKK